jgi:lysozyme
MKPRYQVSRTAIDLIKRFEGYRRRSAQLADGRWTIGYGHTLTAREGAEVSDNDAEALLLYDLIAIAHLINEQVYTPLTQNQFDALSAFAFNIGAENFRRSSVLRRVNEGNLLQAACAMEMWRKADFEGERIVIDALVRRRAAEKTLFLTPPGGWVPAPSPILRPKVDYDAVNAIPRETPQAVTGTLVGDKAVAEREEIEPFPPYPRPVEPTAAERAAAAVGSRLEQILPDAEPEVLPEVTEEAPEPEPVAEPDFALTPAPEAEPAPAEPEPAAEPQAVEGGPSLFESAIATEAEPAARPVAMMDEAEVRRLVRQDEAGMGYEPGFPETQARNNNGVLMLAGLALLGMAMLAGAIFWGFNARAGEGLLSPLSISWVVAILGVALTGLAAYRFLSQLAGDDDGDEEEG